MHLGQVLESPVPPPDSGSEQRVPSHTRRKPRSDFTDDGVSAPFFDESKVPVQMIQSAQPRSAGREARPICGHRREDQSPPGAVAGQLCGA